MINNDYVEKYIRIENNLDFILKLYQDRENKFIYTLPPVTLSTIGLNVLEELGINEIPKYISLVIDRITMLSTNPYISNYLPMKLTLQEKEIEFDSDFSVENIKNYKYVGDTILSGGDTLFNWRYSSPVNVTFNLTGKIKNNVSGVYGILDIVQGEDLNFLTIINYNLLFGNLNTNSIYNVDLDLPTGEILEYNIFSKGSIDYGVNRSPLISVIRYSVDIGVYRLSVRHHYLNDLLNPEEDIVISPIPFLDPNINSIMDFTNLSITDNNINVQLIGKENQYLVIWCLTYILYNNVSQFVNSYKTITDIVWDEILDLNESPVDENYIPKAIWSVLPFTNDLYYFIITDDYKVTYGKINLSLESKIIYQYETLNIIENITPNINGELYISNLSLENFIFIFRGNDEIVINKIDRKLNKNIVLLRKIIPNLNDGNCVIKRVKNIVYITISVKTNFQETIIVTFNLDSEEINIFNVDQTKYVYKTVSCINLCQAAYINCGLTNFVTTDLDIPNTIPPSSLSTPPMLLITFSENVRKNANYSNTCFKLVQKYDERAFSINPYNNFNLFIKLPNNNPFIDSEIFKYILDFRVKYSVEKYEVNPITRIPDEPQSGLSLAEIEMCEEECMNGECGISQGLEFNDAPVQDCCGGQEEKDCRECKKENFHGDSRKSDCARNCFKRCGRAVGKVDDILGLVGPQFNVADFLNIYSTR